MDDAADKTFHAGSPGGAAENRAAEVSADQLAEPGTDTSDEQMHANDGANASRKGQPWTEEEHLAFLAGLKKLGRGAWREISRQHVPTRTPTQVASHAQKHFMRVAGATKRKSRFTALEIQVPPTKPAPVADPEAAAPPAAEPPQPPAQPQSAGAAAFGQPMPAFPTMPFPFMHPMMFGFPGPFFPPFMCPPPFAMATMGAKAPPMPMMLASPMFPMAAMAAMAPAMNPFFMAAAQHMAATAAAAATQQQHTASIAQQPVQAATSGAATTAGTAAAVADTATSDEVGATKPRRSSATGSPSVPKPEAQHARPAAQATPSGDPAAAPAEKNECTSSGSLPEQRSDAAGASGGVRAEPRALLIDGRMPFHASSHSAFRPPQEIKAEG